ncbi:MAG: nuclear transport factor 2 family protein [Acidobacteria bacterium]|nr:nuclear transport factor 2 family protein [Acidobacteriota bacterium]
MANVAELSKKLDDAVLAGKALEAFDELNADDVVMQENSDAPLVGKELNRKREVEFFDSIAEFHGASVLSRAAGDDVSFSEWEMEVTFKNGYRMKLAQAAVRRWKDGKTVNERFYYSK